MLNKTILLGLVLAMGLASAWLPGPEYAEDQYYKAGCIYYYSSDLAGAVDYLLNCTDDGGCPGEALYEEMETSMANLGMYKGTDLPAFAQEYTHFISLFNELRAMFLRYGIEYILTYEPGAIGELMGGLMGWQAQLMGCFAGQGN